MVPRKSTMLTHCPEGTLSRSCFNSFMLCIISVASMGRWVCWSTDTCAAVSAAVGPLGGIALSTDLLKNLSANIVPLWISKEYVS